MTQPGEQGRQAALQEAAHHETVMDVGTQRVAQVYAEALLRAADRRGVADDVLEELETLTKQVFQQSPEFETFLSSGAVDRRRKADLIRSTFEGRADEVFVDALLVLNEHERLDLLRPIATAYRELRDQRAGRMRVQVRTATALPDDQRQRLLQQLRETFHKEPILESQIEPELLGGMVVQVGDWLYDHSVRTQLEDIRNQVIARSSYEIQSRRDRFSSDP
jgi:F-type H+-transporting ATPase subunit delta